MTRKTMLDKLSYKGKRVIVTGAASGLGAATVEVLTDLGAEIISMDIAETSLGSRFIHIDLLDQESIEGAVRQIEGPIHGLFNAAGIGSSQPKRLSLLCNFVGTRHLIEKVIPLMPAGSAIATIATTGAQLYRDSVEDLRPLIETTSFAEAAAWVETNAERFESGYVMSKRAIHIYTILKARQLSPYGIRINTTAPQAARTPMFERFLETAPPDIVHLAYSIDGKSCEPETQAYALAFLNSDAGDYITGINLPVDGGFLTEFAPDTGEIELPPLEINREKVL